MEPLTRFFWFVKPEDLFSEEIEIPAYNPEDPPRTANAVFLNLDLHSGRLKHKWVPRSKGAAIRYLLYHEDAAGLRAASDEYFLVAINFAEPIDNKATTYPKLIPSGFEDAGALIKVPIKEKIMKDGASDSLLPIRFTCNFKSDLIETKEPGEIGGVNMEIMSPEEIETMAVIEVLASESLKDDPSRKGIMISVIDGVMDHRMGSLSKDDECPTCSLPFNPDSNNQRESCSGHFGYIRLPEPVPNLLFLGLTKNQAKNTYPLMEAINKSCVNCSRVMLPQEIMDSMRGAVMQEFEIGGKNIKSRARIRTMLKPYFPDKQSERICPHCKEFSPTLTFTYRNPQHFFLDNLDIEGNKIYQHTKVVDLLSNIPNEDCYFLAINPATSRPEHMFFQNLPVIPNTARPLRVRSDGKTEEDDLTRLYSDVVWAGDRLREIKNKGQQVRREGYARRQLFMAVSRVVDNQNEAVGSGGSSMQYTFGGGESLKSFDGLLNRLVGKTGRMRSNLQSKYVDSVGYSIISPDPNLALDEVGIPIKVCETVSYPRLVTEENLEEMKQYLQNTIDKVHPGATYLHTDGFAGMMDPLILKRNPKIIEENFVRNLEYYIEILSPNMVLETHLIEDDICLFNRAPSLHRQSIMAFRVRPVLTKTIAMNPTVCIPFNADYDGDAMKVHFVQTETAKKEAEKLMLLTKNIIHARYGMLTVATDQDQTSGLYLLTYTDMSKANTWNKGTQVGYNEYGLPYVSKAGAASCYSTVFSEIRGGKERQYRTIDSLPESDVMTPEGPGYTGRALFNHLFTVLDAEYVSASFDGVTPLTKTLENGEIIVDRDENGDKIRENVIIRNGKLLSGTLEKKAFGEGGASIAPSFIYHEGYEAGQAKLVEFIEMVTRLGLSAHRIIGYTMGSSDISAPPVQDYIDQLYTKTAEKILEIDKAFKHGYLKSYVSNHTPEKEVYAMADPLSYIEEQVLSFTDEFEKKLLIPIEDYQGPGNPMQIAVRSRARGKNANIQQMAGSYGLVRLGGKRITHGINSNRVLSHYPRGDLSPQYRGFVRSNYSKGMEPDEYFMTSIAGRRSTVESSQGNIAKSGYMERLMIKALESCVVNKRRQVVNLRTGRIISPLVGDDGLAPYHIRGSDDKVNKRGYTITLQPFFYDFDCKHGFALEESCDQCSKSSDLTTFLKEVDSMVSQQTQNVVLGKLETREMTKPNIKKLAKRLNEYYEDSLCRFGEAIGATAGACIGEPATQAALRTFHFAGKMQSQGSIKRLKQILESPISTDKNNDSPETILRLKEGTSLEDSQKIMSLLAEVKGKQIIKLISYDLDNSLILVKFDFKAMGVYNISPDIAFRQIKSSLTKGSTADLFKFQILSDRIDPETDFVVKIDAVGPSPSVLLYAKELIINSFFNGIGSVTNIELHAPEEDTFGRYYLRILSANKALLDTVVKVFSNLLDLPLMETNNHGWVYSNFGLEAALGNIYKDIDYQMNLAPEGIGEYDTRYIRTIVDCMGEYGEVKSLAPHGLSSSDNPSILAAMSIEGIKDAIVGGSSMGNKDPIRGVTESIVVGATPKVGDFAPE
jgi:DNA-directed RNA polymerase subunit A'